MSERPVIEGYELLGALGAGGHARVWEARDRAGKAVAIKVLRRGADDVAAERLVREARLVRGMDHGSLVRVHDAGRTGDGRPFLVMERVEGRSLAERIEAEGPLTPKEGWALVRRVAEALAHAHSRGVLHRDLTSSNVLLDARGRPKLGDFGLARRAGDPSLSRDGATVGTPAYMAPEQWWGDRLDERTDVYGLGAILYEALCGEAPWAGEDAAELIHRVATAAPAPLRERGAEVPEEVERFVARCLARRPADRPTDVATFLREGDAAFGREPAHRFDPWVALLLVLLAPLAMGYAGSRDPRVWVWESGYAGYGVIGGWVIAALLCWRWPKTRLLAPLLPALNGALGFVTGMQMVERSVASAAPEVRFALFNLGAAEASASWFLGGAASASLFGFVALVDLPRARPSARSLAAAGVALLAGLLAADLPTLLVCGLAATLLLRGVAERAQSALAALAAVLGLGVSAMIKLFGDGARVFEADLTRTERALALIAIDETRTGLLFAGLIALVALAAATRWRGVKAWSRRRAALGLGAAALTLAGLVAPYGAMLERRAELGASLARHLAVWTELDPPSGAGAREGRLGPTLQIGREHVSIDSERVMLTRALEDDAGGAASLVLAQAVGSRLDASEDGPELVVAADRSLPTSAVRRALRAAYDVGVRRVDVLLLAGEPLVLPPGAPPEARLVLPSDVRALPLELEPGHPEGPDRPFRETVAALLRPEGARGFPVGD